MFSYNTSVSNVVSKLGIYYANAHSILSTDAIDYLNYRLYNDLQGKIICFTETWFNSTISNSAFCPNFNIFRCDRPPGKAGGGVAIFVPKNISCSLVPDFTVSNDLFESICVRCSSSVHSPLYICCVYRPPHYHPNFQNFITFLSKLWSHKGRLVIVGDLNFPRLSWSTYTSMPHAYPIEREFMQLVVNYGISQFINFPTRRNNLLDVILSDDPNLVCNVCSSAPFGDANHPSDHLSVSFEVPFGHFQTPKTTPKPNFHKADWTSIEWFLGNVDWIQALNCPNANSMWLSFLNILHEAIYRFVPLSRASVSTSKSKYPKYLKLLYNKQQKFYKIFKRSPSPRNRERYKSASKRFVVARNRYHLMIEQGVLDSHNVNNFWRFVRDRTKVFNAIPPIISSDDVLCETDSDKAAAFNQYFSSVYTISNNLPVPLTQNIKHSINCVEVSPEIVLKYLLRLNCKLSSGPDGIPNLFLRRVAHFICEPLSSIFNVSLLNGCVPENWKVACIIPVPKIYCPSNVDKYRPISLTSSICKVLESIIRDRLLEFCFAHQIFSKTQYGFLPKRSTESQLLSCLNDWHYHLSRRTAVDVIYFDFAKAFDTVCHSKLLSKLYSLGIRGMLWKWIKSYLSNRSQFVKVGDCCSNSSNVNSGVPQGSVLGPILFLLFINDLPDFITYSKIYIYADDVKLYLPINSPADSRLLQSDINSVVQWSNFNQLSLSINKCCVLHLGNTDIHSQYSYFINGRLLVTKNVVKDLGVLIDSNLNFKTHVNSIVQRASLLSTSLFRSFHVKNHAFLTKLFNVFVRPLLEYASTVWSPQSVEGINLVEGVQRRFTKNLSNLREASYSDRLAVLNITSLQSRRVINDLVILYKIVHGLICLDSADFISFSNAFTRGHNLKIYKSRVKDVKIFPNRVISCWNSLSYSTVNAPSTALFRSRILTNDFPHIISVLHGGVHDVA